MIKLTDIAKQVLNESGPETDKVKAQLEASRRRVYNGTPEARLLDKIMVEIRDLNYDQLLDYLKKNMDLYRGKRNWKALALFQSLISTLTKS